MAVKFFAQRLKVFVDRTLSPQAQSAFLAKVARERRNALIASGRASESYRTFVDGREGAAEDTVKPADDGAIVYRFNHLGAVVVYALSYLREGSPKRSGKPVNPAQGKHAHFRDAFYVGVNGKFIMAKDFNPYAVPPDAEIVIGNVNAYSRKVEIQMVGGQKLSFDIPEDLLWRAAKAVRERYGSQVEVKHVYTMSHPKQWLLKREQQWSVGPRAGKSRGRAGRPVESPAIIIKARR